MRLRSILLIGLALLIGASSTSAGGAGTLPTAGPTSDSGPGAGHVREPKAGAPQPWVVF